MGVGTVTMKNVQLAADLRWQRQPIPPELHDPTDGEPPPLDELERQYGHFLLDDDPSPVPSPPPTVPSLRLASGPPMSGPPMIEQANAMWAITILTYESKLVHDGAVIGLQLNRVALPGKFWHRAVVADIVQAR